MEVIKIISREIVKPTASKEMPQDDDEDQNTFKISLFDMYSLQTYTPIIFFYKIDNDLKKEDEIASLKLSLSKTLALFPMVAGRIKGDLIHCSNEGALFMEATVNATMADFLKTPNLRLLRDFLPFPDGTRLKEPLETAVQVAAQVNIFTCRGIAIGLSFLHKIIDGSSMSAFIKSWAASNNEGRLEKLGRGSYKASSSLFLARQTLLGNYKLFFPEILTPFAVPEGKNSSTRRFVFDAMAISTLKAKAMSESVPNPTSVEAVTCFIWKYVIKASRCKSRGKNLLVTKDEEPSSVDTERGSSLVHLVNMRTRIHPHLSQYDIGNMVWLSHSYYETSNNIEIKLADLQVLLRQSFLQINNVFMQKVIGDDGFRTHNYLSSLQQLQELYAKGSDIYIFTSWRNMGFNDVNFKWGKPIWTAYGGSICDSRVRNTVILMDTVAGEEGMEAWIILDDEIMNLFENDDEFLEFVSSNPTINLG